MLKLFSSGDSKTSPETIDSPPLGVTTLAQISGAFTAVVAAVFAIWPPFEALAASDPIKIALIGLVGAGILAWAIAAAGDTLARAYAAAHVTRTERGEDNQPAIQTAATRLADAYAATHGLTPTTPASTAESGASAATTSVYSPSSTAASKECCLELSPPLKVQVRGEDAQATAVLISGESGKETQRYLVGLPGSPLTWVNSDAISMPDAAPPAVQLPSPAASQECFLELSPPLKVKVGPKDGEAIAVQIKTEGGKEIHRYLVGTTGNRYRWELEDAVTMRMS